MVEPWILITLGAATAQAVRFMLQKWLSTSRLSAAGATFARFVYSAPIVAMLVVAYARTTGQDLPAPPPEFWPFALAGAVSQILATICVLCLFKHRNFAVGITLKKSEVILAVLFGLLVLGEGVSAAGFAAIVIGMGGLVLLSDPPGGAGGRWARRIFNPASGLGLASGAFFGFSGVGYRAASLSLGLDDAFLSALATLAWVTAAQTLILAAWLAWREVGEVWRVLVAWRTAGLIGLTSMIGSICWFTAFSLQTVAYVKAVGQVELILSLAASALVFRETVTARELAGVAMLAVSFIGIVLAA